MDHYHSAAFFSCQLWRQRIFSLEADRNLHIRILNAHQVNHKRFSRIKLYSIRSHNICCRFYAFRFIDTKQPRTRLCRLQNEFWFLVAKLLQMYANVNAFVSSGKRLFDLIGDIYHSGETKTQQLFWSFGFQKPKP